MCVSPALRPYAATDSTWASARSGFDLPRVRDLVENAVRARGEIVEPVRHGDLEDASGEVPRAVDIRATKCHVCGLVVRARYGALAGRSRCRLSRCAPCTAICPQPS